MMRADMLKRVAARAGVESTFVDAVLTVMVKEMGDAMRAGYRVTLYPLGYFENGRRAGCVKKVVVEGGGRQRKAFAGRSVPRFFTVRRWVVDQWDI